MHTSYAVPRERSFLSPAGWKIPCFFPKHLHNVQMFWEKDRSCTMLPQAKRAIHSGTCLIGTRTA